MKFFVLFFGTLLGLAVYALYAVFVFIDGTTAVKSWDELCRIQDCEQLPDLHMTYEVDGKRYYYPSGNYYSFLPLGVKSTKGILRPTFRQPHSTREIYKNWRVLDFDLYLETQKDDTLRRGFGRVNADTEIMRFGNGLLPSLTDYFDIETSHPSGKLREFEFYISSKDSSLGKFSFHDHIRGHQLYHSRRGTPASEVPHLLKSFVQRSDLQLAGFESFNDAFWVVSEEYDGNYVTNHVAVISKVPLLHGRHVYGICRSQCWFYPVRFSDDPANDEPLVAVQMLGADMATFRRDVCIDARKEGLCDPDKVNLENIRMRFGLVERIVQALRIHPAAKLD